MLVKDEAIPELVLCILCGQARNGLRSGDGEVVYACMAAHKL